MGLGRLYVKRFLPILGLLFYQAAFCQQAGIETQFSYDNKEKWFDQVVGIENTPLLNGREYSIAFRGATTHPFFGTRDLTNEQVVCRGRMYTNIQLLYDTYGDILVLRHRDSRGLYTLIELDKKYVDRFTLQGHQFRKMNNEKSPEASLADGYFEVVYDGEYVKLVAKHQKESYVNASSRDYRASVRYFFVKGRQWSEVRNNSSAFNLIPGGKRQIAAFIKKNKIRMGRHEEQKLASVAMYCDNLERRIQ